MPSQVKKLKTKILKIGIKQTKGQLPHYKVQNKLDQGKRKSSLKCLHMNSVAKGNEGALNSLLPDRPSDRNQILVECNLRRKRKMYTNMRRTQHSVGPSFQRNDSSGVRLTGNNQTYNQHRDISQQNPMGSPVVVEAVPKNLSSPSIPDALKQKEESKMEGHDVHNNPLHMQSMGNVASVIVGETLNPNDNLYNGAKDTKIVSPSTSNCKPCKNKMQLQNSNSNTTPIQSAKARRPPDICYPGSSGHNSAKSNTLKTATSSNNVVVVSSTVNTVGTIEERTIRFYPLREKVVAIMPKNARFSFTGKLEVNVLYGAIESYGYVTTTWNSPVGIYSPRGHSNVMIETSDKFSNNMISNVWITLSAEPAEKKVEDRLKKDIRGIKPGMAVVLLSNLENDLTRFLSVFYPFRLFPRVDDLSYHTLSELRKAERILQSDLHVDSYTCKEIIINQHIIQEISDKMLIRCYENKWSCTVIAGGKNVGKSTTLRYLINTLLPVSKIVVLVDFDIGQAECTPAGCISYTLIEEPLLGPNFTHLKPPILQLYIGDVDVSQCVSRYVDGIKYLVKKLLCCPILTRLPIVVNTMGFAQGLGLDIILFTIKLMRPSFVVQIMSEKSKNNYIIPLNKEAINAEELPWSDHSTNGIPPCEHELFVMQSKAERKGGPAYDNWNMEPYQKRELVMISYLSEILQNPWNTSERRNSPLPNVVQSIPYVTSIDGLHVSLPRLSVPASHALSVMNGNVVALCEVKADNNRWKQGIYTLGPYMLNTSSICTCYGFGIIRGFDLRRREVYICTPLPAALMRQVNCVVGCMPMPNSLLYGNQRNILPYLGANNVLPLSRQHRRGHVAM